MSTLYPQSLQQLIKELSRLPGIGPKSAQRMAFYLLSRDKQALNALTSSITEAKELIHACPVCGNYTDMDLCPVCSDHSRDRSLLCLVEQARDIASMERCRSYNGLYHVLGGAISPMDGIGPSDLEIESLVKRIEPDNVKEVILALSTTMEGDTTNFYIFRKLAPFNLKITTIARGVAIGDELEYTDEVTLGRSILHRVDFTQSFKQ